LLEKSEYALLLEKSEYAPLLANGTHAGRLQVTTTIALEK